MTEADVIRAARDDLSRRIEHLDERERTLGALCGVARELMSALGEEDARVLFRSLALSGGARMCVELEWHWAHPEALDASPSLVRLRFEVPATANAREVEVRGRDYPHGEAFLSAALRAAKLDEEARATSLHVDYETDHPA